MGKFDGMDPELVRDLLSEVRQAAEQIRSVEGRVTRLMSAAGLSSQSAHRPAQVADSGDKMVRDVSARVALLEKKIKQGTGHEAGPKAAAPKPDTEPSKADDRAPERPKAEDLTPAVPKDGDGPDTGHDSGSHSKQDGGPDAKHDSDARKDSDAKKDAGSDGKQEVRRDAKVEDKPQTGSKGDETSPRRDTSVPDTSARGDDQAQDTSTRRDDQAPDTSARRDDSAQDTSARRDGSIPETSAPRDDSTPESPGGRSDGKIEIVSIGDHDAGQDPGGDAGGKGDTGSKGDERSPRADQTGTQQVGTDQQGTGRQGADQTGTGQQTADQTGTDQTGTGQTGTGQTGTGQTGTDQTGTDQTGTGQGTSGADILDTPRKDHPDDIDQTDPRPKVVTVDGVKVLQIPLNQPTAAEVTDLLNNAGGVPPADMPTVDGTPDPAGAPPAQDASQGVPPAQDAHRGVPAQDTAQGVPTAQDASQRVPTTQYAPSDAPTASQGVPTVQDASHSTSQGVPTTQGTADAPATGTPAPSGDSGTAGVPLDRPGQVEPHGPVRDVKPAFPIPDTVEPVPDQEIQPPGTGGEPASSQHGALRPDGSAAHHSAAHHVVRHPFDAPDAPDARSTGTTGDAVPRQAPPVAGAAAGGGLGGDAGGAGGAGGDVVSARVVPPDPDVLAGLVDDARDVEPMDMPSVRVPGGEVWGEGAWRPMDVGPDGPAGDLDPGDPLRPIPPPGDERQGGR